MADSNEVKIVAQNDQTWHKTAPDKVAYAVFSKFQSNENQVYITADKTLNFRYSTPTSQPKINQSIIPEDGKNDYLELFEKAMSRLEKQQLSKVVLSRKQEFPLQDSDLEIFERLLDTYPTANGYFFYHPQVGKWLGATPELLMDAQSDGLYSAQSRTDAIPLRVSTMSLAGTAVDDGSLNHVWGDKEKEEQQLVTDFIISQFKESGAIDMKQSPVETVQAGHLIHLRTFIQARSSTNQIERLLGALHPTPAVCGLPRDESMEFIVNNENYDRSYYTGYLGIVNGASHHYFVNLRCMQLVDTKAIIYVGGGVTAKSDALLEYQETRAKMQTMHRLL
ncbi:chorismate-binding protein [Nonlabens mediterrranea]|uniref:Chorismate-binding protein n=2 Tax=Nonlabens mediterrranea TaxID=1419947 RepID=A0ABS0A547_9FLAO|nr:chorismate-binding protein [Nonlabens mediterrranea]